ncbi:alpha/beta fold hydrolase [Chitinophaga rhizosphaerae]|uniref:alpha/beta fold hydrolase n=1 Tax=Chitinophaga rhizosphaerae TaxID=1864947 RepID=UPI000F800AB9|nr:alpha/beta hydrolase [Chitinophaga rhizosphaerae]
MTHHRTVHIDGQDIFYREAGDRRNPAIVLLHGFPTSSFMFRNLIPALEDKYYLVAPDFPGFGQSSMPSVHEYAYTFDNLSHTIDAFLGAVGLEKYSLYVMDYGAPVGFRVAARHPEKVEGLIVQNGNAYVEGMEDGFWAPVKKFWASPEDPASIAGASGMTAPASTRWQYEDGVKDLSLVSPDTWTHDQALLDRPGNGDIQLALFFDYRNNPPLYPGWQAYFRTWQPPALVVWGKNDQIFVEAGAHPYKRDLQNVDFHLLDTGHFALETHLPQIATLIDQFMAREVAPKYNRA